MANNKQSRGRPRKYKNDAEKQKAFRERKKKEILKLEKEKEKLETIILKDLEQKIDKKSIWFDWTFYDLKRKSTKELQDCKREIERKLRRISMYSPIKIIIEDILNKAGDLESVLIRNEVIHASREFDIALFDVTVLQLINDELEIRMSNFDFDHEIELAEQRISELEEEIKEKKKHKIRISNQSK